MKKKLLIIIVPVFLLLIAFIYYSDFIVAKSISLTTISHQKYCYNYHADGFVDSNTHTYYLNGSIQDSFFNVNDKVKKDDKILSYINYAGNSKNLISKTNGFIYAFEPDKVLIKDDEYYLRFWLDYSTKKLLKLNTVCSFYLNDHLYRCQVIKIAEIGCEINGDYLYQINCSLPDDCQLDYGQNIELLVPLEEDYGYMVDKRAILWDEEGYYLLLSGFQHNLTNISKYRLDIKVKYLLDDYAIIEGDFFDNVEVCLLPEQLKEILEQ